MHSSFLRDETEGKGLKSFAGLGKGYQNFEPIVNLSIFDFGLFVRL